MTVEPAQRVRLADGLTGTVLSCGSHGTVLVRLDATYDGKSKRWTHHDDLTLID